VKKKGVMTDQQTFNTVEGTVNTCPETSNTVEGTVNGKVGLGTNPQLVGNTRQLVEQLVGG
jgi:hypothetical protein